MSGTSAFVVELQTIAFMYGIFPNFPKMMILYDKYLKCRLGILILSSDVRVQGEATLYGDAPVSVPAMLLYQYLRCSFVSTCLVICPWV